MYHGLAMYKLELDLALHLSPPMDERGAGIMLTRQLALPFAPMPGLAVFSRKMDDGRAEAALLAEYGRLKLVREGVIGGAFG
jgi:hypothetical protein